jgi:hypothetical protein
VTSAWLHDDGIDDEAWENRAVRVTSYDRLVDQLLADDDDSFGRERHLLLTPEHSPYLSVSARVGPLHVDDGDIGMEWRDRIHGLRPKG